MPFMREIHMHLPGEFCAKLFYNLGSLSPRSCPYMEYPRVLDAFPQLAMRSKWRFLKHRGTLILWRSSLFFFFKLFSTVGWSRVGAFSSWRDLVSDFSCSLLLLITHRQWRSGGVGWGLFVSFLSVLFFELISGVLGQQCLLVLVKTNLQTPCLSTLITLQAPYLVLCLTSARRSWLNFFTELGFSKLTIISKCTKVP